MRLLSSVHHLERPKNGPTSNVVRSCVEEGQFCRCSISSGSRPGISRQNTRWEMVEREGVDEEFMNRQLQVILETEEKECLEIVQRDELQDKGGGGIV